MTEPDGSCRGSPGPARGHRAVVRRELERFLAIRHTGDVLMGGASGAGSLLRCFCVEQEAARSRAPAAIAPGQEPEPHDAGVSRFAEIGSHLEATDVAEDHAGQMAFRRERTRAGVRRSGKARRARSFPPASVMTGGPTGPSTQCARDRPTLPDPVGHANHGHNAVRKGCP